MAASLNADGLMLGASDELREAEGSEGGCHWDQEEDCTLALLGLSLLKEKGMP